MLWKKISLDFNERISIYFWNKIYKELCILMIAFCLNTDVYHFHIIILFVLFGVFWNSLHYFIYESQYNESCINLMILNYTLYYILSHHILSLRSSWLWIDLSKTKTQKSYIPYMWKYWWCFFIWQFGNFAFKLWN